MSMEEQIRSRMGEEVTIQVASVSAYPDAPKVMTYTGIICKSESWDPAKTFRFSGCKEFPTRVIQYKKVIAIDDHYANAADSLGDKEPQLVRVPSSDGKRDYVVTLDPINGDLCPCKGFGFRKTCSHIKLAHEMVEQEEQDV